MKTIYKPLIILNLCFLSLLTACNNSKKNTEDNPETC